MVQYKTNVTWDATLVALELVEDDAITRHAGIAGLVQFAIKITTGAPVATANKFIKAAQIQNAFDGTWYENTGSVASPIWSLVPSSGSGITRLTGDVTAGPGTGSQAATVAGLSGVPLNAAATVDASLYVFDSTPGGFNPVVLSADATMDNTGAVTVTGLDGLPLSAPASTDTNFYVSDGAQLNPVSMSQDATMDNTGAVTVKGAQGQFTVGGYLIDSLSANLPAPSVLPVTNGQLELTTAGTGDAFSLPDGVAGQTLTILYVAEGAGSDTAVVTPTNLAGGSTITFANLGDAALLKFSATGGWYFVSGTAVLA